MHTSEIFVVEMSTKTSTMEAMQLTFPIVNLGRGESTKKAREHFVPCTCQ